VRYFPLLLLLLATQAFARLGETREQAEARYGLPKSEKPPQFGPPLLKGARELTFVYEGWRIRCALLPAKDGQEYIVREEYTRSAGNPIIQGFEREAILEAESNGLKWGPKRAELSLNPLRAVENQVKGMLGGATFVRSDGAIAVHSQSMFPLRLELPQARKWEEEMARIAEERARAEAQRVFGQRGASRP
jgi:hypothetical protein